MWINKAIANLENKIAEINANFKKAYQNSDQISEIMEWSYYNLKKEETSALIS